jgi:hypothetical protein
MASAEGGGGALTAADLHLAGDDNDDDTEYTDRTDDDSFLENSSLRKMMKNSIQMLDTLTDEMKEMTRDDFTTTTKSTKTKSLGGGPLKPRIVTPTSSSAAAASGQGNHRDDKIFKDMTISVSLDSHNDTKTRNKVSTSCTTPANNSVLTSPSSNLASPLISPMNASIIKNTTGATEVPSLGDVSTTKVQVDDDHHHHNHLDHHRSDHEHYDDDLSLDDSLVNEMNALKQVAFELERELQSTDSHTVQKAIERIGNSQDPKVKGILESEDKVIIRKILDDEIQKNEPQNKLFRYLYKAVMNTLTEDETTHLLVAIVLIVWSIVLGLIYRAMTEDVIA